jgi:puromycin-sensitive aminopeptidase
MMERFTTSIVDMSMPPLDRLGLIDDLFALVQAGEQPTVEALKLIEAYRNENNYTVWSSISNCLMKLQALISHTDLEAQFDEYASRLFKPIAERLGWNATEGESHLDTLLRSLVLNRLVSFSCGTTSQEAKKRFEAHASGKSILPADLRSVCYKAILQTGDTDTYELMLKLYRATDLHEEKDRISRALGSIRDVDILKRVIEFAMSDEVRAQDSVFIIVAVALNPKGREMAWEFFKQNRQQLLDQYEGGFLLSRLVKHLTENFASEEKAREVEEFFKQYSFPGTERTVSQSVETIRLNTKWLNRDFQTIREFLLQQ